MNQHALNFGRVRPSSTTISIFAIPMLACAYAVVVSPVWTFLDYNPSSTIGIMESRYENRIFWPAMAAMSFIYVLLHPAPRSSIYYPPHVICLALYLALAGASILWAFSPEASFTRLVQQVLVVTSIFLPAFMSDRPMDMMRGLFFWFAIACVLNMSFVLGSTEALINEGQRGYFFGKNTLGQCAAAALLLSLHEMLYPGRRRVAGIIVAAISIWLVLVANSKTALGLALLAPLVAILVLILYRTIRLSPAILPVAIVSFYFVLSTVSKFSVNHISYWLYGDWTFTGRTMIWDFVFNEIRRKPLFGWGYRSFWLVGPDAPSVVNAPGWVSLTPNAHNGYYDTIVETGYIGLILLLGFIVFTLHSIGRVADKEPKRAWLLLSLAFFVIIYNGLESIWLRGFEFLWVVFMIVAADAARYQQPWHRGSRSLQVRRSPPAPRRYSPALRRSGA